MINEVILLGNLTSDPEIRTTSAGKEVCRFSIALNSKSASGDRTVDYINCAAWEDVGRRLARYLRKGDGICVIGSIKMSKYKTAHGDSATTCTINVKEFSFGCSPRREDRSPRNDEEPEVSLPVKDEDDESGLPF